jgi:NAD+ kinase
LTVAAVGIVVHHLRPRAVDAGRRAAQWLGARGHEPRLPPADAEAAGLESWAYKEEPFAAGLDLMLAVGGDGTMLRAVDMVGAHDVPVLGLNVGEMGYLTEVEPSDMEEALAGFLSGDYGIEERMTLNVAIEAPSGAVPPAEWVALNEAVLEKTAPGHTVRLSVSVNGRFFTTFAADGLIVATPTGSTAYALSARGPIVSPRHRALLVTPVAPHMLFDRTLVLDPSESVRLEVIDGRPATVSVDGRDAGRLMEGDAIACRAGERSARLVTFGERDFHGILKAKFGLADR